LVVVITNMLVSLFSRVQCSACAISPAADDRAAPSLQEWRAAAVIRSRRRVQHAFIVRKIEARATRAVAARVLRDWHGRAAPRAARRARAGTVARLHAAHNLLGAFRCWDRWLDAARWDRIAAGVARLERRAALRGAALAFRAFSKQVSPAVPLSGCRGRRVFPYSTGSRTALQYWF
jgi:hypothetical protein